ncbi:MAG: hypothetical protein HZA20_05050 [Nitrospirae bacterium]|nr:hypothetical protein [Nitrospirota bacterium]
MALIFFVPAASPAASPAAETGDVESVIAIVVHKSNTENITVDGIKEIFLGQRATWASSGAGIRVVLQPKNSSPNRAFNRLLFNDSGYKMSWQWVENIVTGLVPAPATLHNDEEVIDSISRDPAAIGYVGSLSARTCGDVRIVLSIGHVRRAH